MREVGREIERERRREGEKEGGGILAALHGILGPTGAAVPGENPFTGYTLASDSVTHSSR